MENKIALLIICSIGIGIVLFEGISAQETLQEMIEINNENFDTLDEINEFPEESELGDSPSGIISLETELTDEQIESLRNGGFYINIHTENHQSGEIRGQILNSENDDENGNGTILIANLEGSQEVPPVDTEASGEVSIIISENMLFVEGTFNGLSSELHSISGSSAHIHQGLPGENGPVVFPLEVKKVTDNEEEAEMNGEETIQQMIDEAEEGETITVPPGIYVEDIEINKTVELEGEDVTLQGTVNITADDSRLVFFTITNYNVSDGAPVVHILADNVDVFNNHFIRTEDAIEVVIEGRNTILENNIFNSSEISTESPMVEIRGDANNTRLFNINEFIGGPEGQFDPLRMVSLEEGTYILIQDNAFKNVDERAIFVSGKGSNLYFDINSFFDDGIIFINDRPALLNGFTNLTAAAEIIEEENSNAEVIFGFNLDENMTDGDDNGENGIIVTASSFDERDGGHPPENTLDNKLDTRWSAEGDGEWIKYDLGQEKKITSLDISFYRGDQRIQEFTIEISDDNNEWTEIFEGESSGGTLEFQNFDFEDVDARYIRIVGHTNTENAWNSLTEVKINLGNGDDGPSDDIIPALFKIDLNKGWNVVKIPEFVFEGYGNVAGIETNNAEEVFESISETVEYIIYEEENEIIEIDENLEGDIPEATTEYYIYLRDDDTLIVS